MKERPNENKNIKQKQDPSNNTLPMVYKQNKINIKAKSNAPVLEEK